MNSIPTSKTTTRTETVTAFQSSDVAALPKELMPKILSGTGKLRDLEALGCVNHAWSQACEPLLKSIRALAVGSTQEQKTALSNIPLGQADAQRYAISYTRRQLEKSQHGAQDRSSDIALSNAFMNLGPDKNDLAGAFTMLRDISATQWIDIVSGLPDSLDSKLALLALCFHPLAEDVFIDEENLSQVKAYAAQIFNSLVNSLGTRDDATLSIRNAVADFDSEQLRFDLELSVHCLLLQGDDLDREACGPSSSHPRMR